MKKIIFICTGNTCRSPMAMALFNNLSKEKNLDMYADSAGLNVFSSTPYSENSINILEQNNIKLSGSSKLATKELLTNYDYIVGLTKNHCDFLKQTFPYFSNKIYTFPLEVNDPFGGDMQIYKDCFDSIFKGVTAIINFILENSNE